MSRRHSRIGLITLPLIILAASILLQPVLANPGSLVLKNCTAWRWNTETTVSSVAAGDVDGDGSVEVVTGGNYHDGTRYRAQLVIWTGSTLAAEKATTWYWTGDTYITSVAVGDVDGDAAVEIVTGGYYYDGVRNVAQLAVWNGGTLALEGVKVWYWTADTCINAVAVGDVDKDGSVEIVTGGYYYDGVRNVAQLAVWNGGTLALKGVRTWYWTGNTETISLAVGDVDKDGSVEIVTGGYYNDNTRNCAQLIVWDGSALTVESVRTWYWNDDTNILSVAIGDVDGDGGVEIVTGGYYYDGARYVAQLAVWSGDALTLEGVRAWYWTGDTHINTVAVGDVDGDSGVEIVTGGYFFDGVRYCAQLVVWNGSTLAVKQVQTWYWNSDTTISSVAIGNVDADPASEVITGGYYLDEEYCLAAQLTVWAVSV